MEQEFVLNLPMFALLFPDRTGTIFVQHGEDILLPLFTDRDAVVTFLDRSDIKNCWVKEMATPAELGAFLRDPPSRSPRGGRGDADRVVIDLIDDNPRRVTVLTVAQLLASVTA